MSNRRSWARTPNEFSTEFAAALRRPLPMQRPSPAVSGHGCRGRGACLTAQRTAESTPSRARESRAEQRLTVEVEAAHAMVGLLGEVEQAALRIDGETEKAVAGGPLGRAQRERRRRPTG